MSTKAKSFNHYNLRVPEVAKMLGYHEQYVRHLASIGSLPAIKRGRLWLFSEEEILEKYENETKALHAKGETGNDKNGAIDLLQ
jgi:excisionase family DNA binding protein